jgi:outer membrane protein assembly factor BamB
LAVSYDGFLTVEDYKGAQNQVFNFKQHDGKYKVRAPANGKLMSISNDSLFAGSVVTFGIEGQHKSELWSIDPVQKPEFNHLGNVFSIRSWTFHSLDVPGNDFSNGKKIEVHGYHGGANQVWIFKEI